MNNFFQRFGIVLTLIMMCSAVTLTSCKKDAADLVDKKTEGVPPASPDAVIDPEPNIGGPETAPNTPPAPPADGKYPVMTFTEKEYDFGMINKGDKVTHSFEFKNTGEADLIITDAKASCGCTVPEFPKDPIAPGKSGKITVSFNSTGKNGQQNKMVTIMTNTVNIREKINIKASIKEEPKK